jgi:hypothetical protein
MGSDLMVETLVFEEHDSVLVEWWRRDFRDLTVIYLDAHLDLQKVSPKRIVELKRCCNLTSFVKLGKPYFFFPDRHYAYSLENFLYAAGCLGIVKHLIWVRQPARHRIPTTASFQVIEGYTIDSLSPDTDDGTIRTEILGLDLTICTPQSIRDLSIPKNAVIDIDTDFFLDHRKGGPWTDPGETFLLLERLGKPRLVTITRSVKSGFVPLRHRYWADYLHAHLPPVRKPLGHGLHSRPPKGGVPCAQWS